MPTAKTRRANGHIWYIEWFKRTKRDATELKEKLKKDSHYGGIMIFPTSSGYEIGWRR